MVGENVPQNMSIIQKDMGGDVRKMLEKLDKPNVAFEHCGQKFNRLNEDYVVAGYEHKNGVQADNGRNYWMTAVCPECGYQLTLKHDQFFTNIREDISKLFNE